MDTQFTVTYQITDVFMGKSFVTNEEYLARYHYERACHVTEIHTTVTLLPPQSKTLLQITKNWHDNDPEHHNHDSESEEE